MAVPHLFLDEIGAIKRNYLDDNFGAVDRPGVFNIKNFGAKSDGVTDDSAAFARAYQAAASYFANGVWGGVVYIPEGNTLITAQNFLGNIDFTLEAPGNPGRLWLTFVGEGMSSIITWRPTGNTAMWAYISDGTAAAKNRLAVPEFRNFQIMCDLTNVTAPGTVNGFSCTSTVPFPVQALRFLGFRWVGAVYPASNADIAKTGTFIALGGNVNASETMVEMSFINGMTTVLSLGPNPESVNHNFINCNCEIIYGDCFQIAGGSNLNVYGGSYTMMSQGPVQSYFAAFRATTAAIVGTYCFDGARLELDQNQALGTFSNLLLIDATSQPTQYQVGGGVVHFKNFNTYPTATPARNTITVDAATRMQVTFSACDGFNQTLHQLNFTNSQPTLQTLSPGPFTDVSFVDGTAIPFGQISFSAANAVGRVSSRNCSNVLDYDITAAGYGESSTGRTRNIKTVTMWGPRWPDPGNNFPITSVLPPGALLKAIRARKTADGSGSGAVYQLRATDNNAVVNYAVSVAAAQNVLHELNVDNLNLVLGTGLAANQFVNITTVPANPGNNVNTQIRPADYVMVDYI